MVISHMHIHFLLAASNIISCTVDMKPPVKVEDVKHEFKADDNNSTPSSQNVVSQVPKKEEEYDSSATVRISYLL
jgi:hypothetical protein